MPRKRIVFVFLVLLLLFCAPAGWAWNRAGHMVTGILAYKELKATNPAALQRIITLLKAHPDYAKWEAQIGQQQLGDEYGEMYLLALAARWADDVRHAQGRSIIGTFGGLFGSAALLVKRGRDWYKQPL